MEEFSSVGYPTIQKGDLALVFQAIDTDGMFQRTTCTDKWKGHLYSKKIFNEKLSTVPFTIQFIILKVKKYNQNLTHVGFCKIHTEKWKEIYILFLISV